MKTSFCNGVILQILVCLFISREEKIKYFFMFRLKNFKVNLFFLTNHSLKENYILFNFLKSIRLHTNETKKSNFFTHFKVGFERSE